MALNQQQQKHQQRLADESQTSSVNAPVQNNSALKSSLDDSEWILFSPAASSLENEDDILSSTESQRHARGRVGDAESGSEIEDSIIDSFNEQLASGNANSMYSNDDLETRIDNWRKEQVQDMLRSLVKISESDELDFDKAEFMKCWGIDNGKFKLRHTKKQHHKTKQQQPNSGVASSQTRNLGKAFTPYGTELLKTYNLQDIETIKRLMRKLSTDLKSKEQHANQKRPLSLHQTYLRNLKELNKEANANANANASPAKEGNEQPHLNTHHTLRHHYHPHSQRLLHNSSLEKYFPIFIKDLIIENKNKSISKVHNPRDSLNHGMFWENDLLSCNSSILTMSTNSIMFNFNFNEIA